MSSTPIELRELATDLTASRQDFESVLADAGVDRIEECAETIGRAWCGSWIGYHARIYYANYLPPPAEAHFSIEWGPRESLSGGTVGDWKLHTASDVDDAIRELAGNPDLSLAREGANELTAAIASARDTLLSVGEIVSANRTDAFVVRLLEDAKSCKPVSGTAIVQYQAPSQVRSRDSEAMHQGIQVPPHIAVLAEVTALKSTVSSASDICDIAIKLASHLERLERASIRDSRLGTNVFIGHGASRQWLELKGFVSDRLSLPWDEFNRVTVAGVTNIERLSQMLDAAAIALLVMTAEDELADGGVQARANVIHEAGLFQGRLGFSKAVVLLENGCEEFSNIAGLGQIRFPKDQISAVFEDVRRVREREGVIDA